MKRFVVLLIAIFFILFALACTASMGYNDEIFSFLKSDGIVSITVAGAGLILSAIILYIIYRILTKSEVVEKDYPHPPKISRDFLSLSEDFEKFAKNKK